MFHFLLSYALQGISLRGLYVLCIRASALTVVVWAGILAGAESWMPQTGLTVILIILLIGGIVLLYAGIRDLIRDFRKFIHEQSEKNGHASA